MKDQTSIGLLADEFFNSCLRQMRNDRDESLCRIRPLRIKRAACMIEQSGKRAAPTDKNKPHVSLPARILSQQGLVIYEDRSGR
jgi:hypothetical protein